MSARSGAREQRRLRKRSRDEVGKPGGLGYDCDLHGQVLVMGVSVSLLLALRRELMLVYRSLSLGVGWELFFCESCV